ncbi:MAG: glycosyltransferase family 9 protein, partial [Magnetovibrio sp.]|nr:glycosyltransferase family 9 protein [Magnetovibrio sp.]
MTSSVLVIKLGALGDFVQALGPMAAIRRHHDGARIVLLTTEPFREFAQASGLADEVWIDSRPSGLRLDLWLDLRRRLRAGGFQRIYDLQTSDRSSAYYRLFWPGPRPEWSGIAAGCSHPHANPGRDLMHTIERQREQLAMAGIDAVPAPNLDWAEAELAGFGLDAPYALLAPGGARHRPGKRWPAPRFAEVARHLAGSDVQPVLIGGADEAELLGEIAAAAPGSVNLAGRTSLLELAALGRGAELALGNDTGPMHALAVAGAPALGLYAHASD